MPDADPENWQPIRQMPLIAGRIDGALDEARDHVGTLNKARAWLHVLDDAAGGRADRREGRMVRVFAAVRQLSVLS